MLRTVLAGWACGLAGAVALSAQPPAPAANPLPGGDALLDSKVDRLLRAWHERTQKIDTMHVEFQRISKDLVFKKDLKHDGVAVFRKPNLARMNIHSPTIGPKGERTPEEVFILTDVDPDGKPLPRLEVWRYRVEKKEIEIFEVQDDRGKNLNEDGPLKLLFGVNPQNAHAQYDFKILNEANGMTLVRISPKLAKGREEFLFSEVWLDTNTYLPRRLTVKETNDTTVTYDFPKQAVVNAEIDRKNFLPVRVPGYRIVRGDKARAGEPASALAPAAANR